jgi:hypothetical protein
MGNAIAERIKASQANKVVKLTRSQKLAAREELKKLTEAHAPEVIKTLASLVKDHKTPASSRVAAGSAILDRYAGKPLKEDEKPLESQYERMSEGQLLGAICDNIWGLSSNARAVIAETIVAAEQGVRIDTDQLGREIDREAQEEAKASPAPKPKREPRR